MASLSHSNSDMVVNLIDDLMLLFSFLVSSSYFFMLFKSIFVDKFSPPGLNLSFVKPLNPGVFDFVGYYSSIFCILTFSFYKVVIFVFSFIFYDERKLFFSMLRD